jgi:hypothetical protein
VKDFRLFSFSNELRSIYFFHQRFLQMRHVLVETASSMFTRNASGQRNILMMHVTHPRHQKQFSTDVWARIGDDYLVGPHVLTRQLTGNPLPRFSLINLPELLEDVPLRFTARM